MKNTKRILLYIFLLFAFLAGIYVCLTNGIVNNTENMSDKDGPTDDQRPDQSNCPDLLIKKGNSLLLYNTKMPEVDGVNPIPFFTLDDYINYLEVQRKKGIHCPVLFFQEENDTQGNNVFRMRPSPFYVEGGLPPLPMQIHDNTVIQNVIDASRENPPYNSNNYSGFDPYGQYIGRYTNVDQVHNSTMNTNVEKSGSDNPMDPNWGGLNVTQKAVESGKYKENEVTRVIYPKVLPTM